MIRPLTFIIVLFCLVACSPRVLVVNEFADMINEGMGALESETDLELARQAFPGNIKLLETMLANDPANPTLRLLLARLYASYAFAFLETDLDAARLGAAASVDPDALSHRAVVFYQRAEAYALGVLEASHPGLTRKLEQVTTIEAVLATMAPGDAPALFWYGFSLGARINLQQDDVSLLVRVPIAAAALRRVVALAPAYFHGGAHMALMIYYGGRSPAMGGRPDLADEHYARLKAIAGDDFFLADVLYARHALVIRADRDGFVRLLTAAGDISQERAAYGLMNAVARRRAAIYLSAVDDLFL